MRVRVSFDALRLCLLVTAGLTSGYLWRAAFESSSPDQRLAATPRIVVKAPTPKTVRIQPRLVARPPAHRAVARRVVKRTVVVRHGRRAPATLISAPVVSSPRPQPAAPTPKPNPKPTPPSNKPTPSPPPTTTTPTQTTTPPVSAPTQAAAAPPSPTTSTNSEDESQHGDSRPGWGKGDKNHDHDGPGNKKP